MGTPWPAGVFSGRFLSPSVGTEAPEWISLPIRDWTQLGGAGGWRQQGWGCSCYRSPRSHLASPLLLGKASHRRHD